MSTRQSWLLTVGLLLAMTPSLGAFGRGAISAGARVGPVGTSAGVTARGVSVGPFGGVQAGQIRGGSITTPGGFTVQRAGGAGISRGPLGNTTVGGGSATRVITPSGQTFTQVQGGAISRGPVGGTNVRGGSIASVQTPWGTGAAVGRGSSITTGPFGGATASSVGGAAVRTPFGTSAVGSRSTLGISPWGTARVSHSTTYWNANRISNSATIVRRSFRTPIFTPNWYAVQRNIWVAPRWVGGTTVWVPPVWRSIYPFVAVAATPILYDYGRTLIIQDNRVFFNGAPLASATDFAAQAIQIADMGRRFPVDNNDAWQPLGVFGLIREDETTAQRIFQLAINSSGVVRGNYYDAMTNTTLPVYGALDKRTQRVAWSIGDATNIVFETGLANFTQNETTVLIHHGKDGIEQMILVRLEEPK